ncbi:MAG: T9SS type A sorting domain-containing protein [Bacteroidota bacterium]
MGTLKLTPKPQNSTRLTIRNILTVTLSLLMLASVLFYGTSNNGASSLDTDGDGITNDLDLDDDNDGIPDSEEGSYVKTLINGDFELLDASQATNVWGRAPKRAMALWEIDIPGWNTTASNNRIEVWETGFGGVSSYSNGHHAEINAFTNAELYQEVYFARAGIIHWTISHRARKGVDSMNILIGPVGNQTEVARVGTSTSGWQRYAGTYALTSENTVRFSFNAVSTGSRNASIGNFIDLFEVYIEEDFDGDGIVNSQDLDSDNDGIPDIIEAGGTDTDGDGQVDYAMAGDATTMTDVDGDGLYDPLDDKDSGSGGNEVTNGSALGTPDTDGDGMKDFTDIDADNDGIVDNTEAQSTTSYTAPSGQDSDNDGLDDTYDVDCQPCSAITGAFIVPVNSDSDALPDYIDTDSDDDMIGDIIEGHDTNGDGVVDENDAPMANAGAIGDSSDLDHDGLYDGFDNDIVSNNPTNGISSPVSYPNTTSSRNDQDWRYSNIQNLPVEWLEFSVKWGQRGAELQWITAVEINNDYFAVQRSEDGRTFQHVGNVMGVGNSQAPSTYNYTDAELGLPTADRFYYRLQQFDIDGAHSFSKIIELSREAASSLTLKAIPNPTIDQLILKIEGLSGQGRASVIDLQGRIIWQSDAPQPLTELDVSGWARGPYVVVVQSAREKVSQKLVLR